MRIEESLADYPHKLAVWFHQNKRAMPWRETADPYAIWVSETMLQQTRVDTVIPYFHAFMHRFPTVTQLADAPEESVLKLWQGLGYYSRARNLHAAAKQVVAEHGGRIPADAASFRKLPGVGPYTVGAVFSIAFGQPVPAVDGNVLRVMTRFLGLRDAIESPAVQREIAGTVHQWLEIEPPRDLTQAFMELGATVCQPRQAACETCPLAGGCTAYGDGTVLDLPVRRKKQARKVVDVYSLWWEMDGQVVMEQRSPEGLLAGMWQLPAVEVPRGNVSASGDGHAVVLRRKLADYLRAAGADYVADSGLREFALIAEEKHIFTHLEWYVKVYRPVGWDVTPEMITLPERNLAVPRAELDRLAVPRVYEKLIDQITGGSYSAPAPASR